MVKLKRNFIVLFVCFIFMFQFVFSSDFAIRSASDNSVYFFVNGTNGNIGILKGNPSEKLDVLGNIKSSGQLISTIATGTSPIVVSSTTKVTNLNSDLLDGHDSSYFMVATTDNWVNTAGDTMSGILNMNGNSITNIGIAGTSFSSSGLIVKGTISGSIDATNITSGILHLDRIPTIPNSKLQNSALTVTAGTGLNGGGSISLGGSATLNLANTAVTAGSYGNTDGVQYSRFTVDAQGRITSASTTSIRSATTSQTGIVQLSSSTSSTSTTLAATASAVKSAYDLAATKVSKSGDTMSGTLNMNGNSITNIGIAGTSFSSSGLTVKGTISGSIDATNITSGTLSTDRYDAYNDLSVSGRINYDAVTDLVLKSQLISELNFLNTSISSDYLRRDRNEEISGSYTFSGGNVFFDTDVFFKDNVTFVNAQSTRANTTFEVTDLSGVTQSILGVVGSSGRLTLKNSGTDRIILDANGNSYITNNLGIGNTNPGQKLDVTGNIRASNQLISTVATGTSPLVVSSTTKVTNLNSDLLDGHDSSYFMVGTTDNWVNTAGDSMTGHLTMSGTAANIILGSNYLSGDGGDEGISVTSAGNVGIGKTGATEKLDVIGNIKASGTISGSIDSSNITSGVLHLDRIPTITNAKLQNSALTVTAGTGLSGGGSISLGGSATINLANTAVTAGTYGASAGIQYSKLTVDAQGRLTAASTETIRSATTSQTGIVQLSSSTSSTSTTLAATASAVKSAYDLAATKVSKSGDTMTGVLTSSVATGTAPFIVSSTTKVGNLNADLLDGYDSSEITYYHSGSDFPDGTLVRTNIPASASEGASFVIEISGKSYSSTNLPYLVIGQGYLYSNTIINSAVLSYGGEFGSRMKMFENGGYLCFWWPRISYWNSFNVHVRDAGGSNKNRVTSVINSVELFSTKEVNVSVKKSWNENNDGSGSGLNSDLLDGYDSSYFMVGTADNWVNTAGDTMSGTLNMNGNSIINIGISGTSFSGSGLIVKGTISGSIAASNITSGVLSIDRIPTITNAKLQNSALTVTAGTGLSGGGSISLGGSATINLANTTVTAGTYGASAGIQYSKLTVDAQGRLTAASTETIRSATTSQTGIVQLSSSTSSTSTTLAATASAVKSAYDLAASKVSKSGDTMSGTLNMNGNSITNIGISGTSFSGSGLIVKGTISGSIDATNITSGILSIDRIPTITNAKLQNSALTVTAGTGLSGGGSISLGGSATINLANTTVTAGTYGASAGIQYSKLTVDAQGRLTAASTETIRSATTSQTGIVQLSSSTSSTSTTLAATASAVKSAYDLAASKVSKSGDTMSGTLNMNGNSITNVGNLTVGDKINLGGNLGMVLDTDGETLIIGDVSSY